MAVRDDVSVRDAASALGVEPWVIARLCHYLRIDPLRERVPRQVLDRAKQRHQVEERYAALRSWLLHHRVPASSM